MPGAAAGPQLPRRLEEFEPMPSMPYFATAASDRYIDVDVAARLDEVPLEEFLALNPAHKLNMISKKARTQIVLPVGKLESFISNLENYREPPKREQAAKRNPSSKPQGRTTYLVKSGDTLATIASKLELTESQLKAWNPAAKKGIRVGQKLRVQPN